MKTIEQLAQEAKQARDDVALALAEVLPYGTGSVIADKLILASVAMVTYQFALGMQEVSGDGSGESLPEVSQEERDSDGFIKWDGGDCPVKSSETVEVKFRLQAMRNGVDMAGVYRWTHADKSDTVDGDPQGDIVAYKIVKG